MNLLAEVLIRAAHRARADGAHRLSRALFGAALDLLNPSPAWFRSLTKFDR